MEDRVSSAYEAKVRAGALERDGAQQELAGKLDELVRSLDLYQRSRARLALRRMLSKKVERPRGFYIFGEVGRGKTMLMDLFYEACGVRAKRRVHFHAFMQDVHARIHEWRLAKSKGEVKGDDPIAPVADQLMSEAWLLCFDEFAVTDITDAMLLGRLFTALFERGCVVTATSNVEPSRLYLGGLNRALFLPFIAKLEKNVEVIRLDSRTDFRLEKLANAKVYYHPADDTARARLDDIFVRLSGERRGIPLELSFLGRKLIVKEAANRVARFTFQELCEQPLGAADYLALAEHFHTVILAGVPAMRQSRRNEAKRFITLVDTFYDKRVKLILSAATSPDRLYLAEDGTEAFEFQRTASRLFEMQSLDYLRLPHGSDGLVANGVSSGLAET